MNIQVNINGKRYSDDVEPRLLLIHYLREVVGLTGPHIGCETSLCGACTVELDGKAVKSCTMFAVQADGANIVTIEGLAANGKLHAMQEAFWNEHGAAVRLLHAGHDHGVETDSGPQSESDRRRNPAWHGRQSLPLHRISAHRQRGEGGGESGGEHRPWRPPSPNPKRWSASASAGAKIRG